MRAVQLLAWQTEAQVVDVPLPTAGPGQVVIKVAGAGACHSDLHIMHMMSDGMFPWGPPFTLGHENAGWVHEIGAGVEGFSVGEPVAVHGPWGCGACSRCRSGIDQYCSDQLSAAGDGAFGGGLGLICACDFAVAVDSAKFGTTEAKVGVFPMMILPVLMRVIPRRRLQEMCFFAHRFSAAEAQRFDIVNEVVPASELDTAVNAMVEKLAANSPVALRIGRRAISAVTDLSFSDALNLTQAVLPILSQSEDTKEGMKAFAERRAPVWPGR